MREVRYLGGSNPRFVVIGIDGATWNVIEPMMERGLLPGITRMVQEGAYGPLESTKPPLSPSAWTSIFTGVGPGLHGIFSFVKRKEDSYFIRPISSRDRSAVPIWRMLSRQGYETIALNIPFSYPPDRLSGVMTTGLGTPSKGSDFTYPKEFKHELLNKYPGYDVDFNEDLILLGTDKDPTERIHQVTEEQIKVSKDLFVNKEWDLFVSVLRSTDVIQHFYWDDQEAMDRFYSQADGLIDWVLTHLDKETYLLVCSDHGFDRVGYRINMNVWLRDCGFMSSKNRPGKNPIRRIMPSAETVQNAMISLGLKDIVNRLKRSKLVEVAMRHVFSSDRYDYINEIEWGDTKAYFMNSSYGQIHLNKLGREPMGCVTLEEEKGILESIRDNALALKDPNTGQRVIHEVHMGSDLYGDALPERPDLTILAKNGYVPVAGRLDGGPIFEEEKRKIADHTQFGIVLAYGERIPRGMAIEGASVLDIVPTILRLFNIDYSGPLEGKPLGCMDRERNAVGGGK